MSTSSGILAIALALSILAAPATAQEAGDVVTGTGTIEFIEVEGGFYGLIADDGTHYFPQNLSENFQINGTRVRFELTVAEQQDSFYMWGIQVHIDFIQPVLEKGTTASGTGIVRYLSDEQTYGIITDDGYRLAPTNLPEEFKFNGTYIQFDYTVGTSQTNSSWGTAVVLANAELAPQSCTSCESYWWAYSMILVALAAFIIFRMKRHHRGRNDDQEKR